VAVIRFPEDIWKAARAHLLDQIGEHFGFFLAKWAYSRREPVFMVRDFMPISDRELESSGFGLQMSTGALLQIVNSAVRTGHCLIEAHNHGGSLPRFSRTDRSELPDLISYMHASLDHRPYAATVWGDRSIFGEYYLADGGHGVIRSVTALGDRLRQLVSRDDDLSGIPDEFDRQLPWFTQAGQREISRLRVAVVGCGGTGSHFIQQLAFLGLRNFILIDNDIADATNLNRVVTANAKDVGTPKVDLARRLIEGLAPNAQVVALQVRIQSFEALDSLKGADILFGCVDNDGARLILNELALAYSIPYFDLAVGIDASNGTVGAAGGRLCFVRPNGRCLYCMGEIDQEEASYFLANSVHQREHRERGYVTGLDVTAPSVVSLNGLIASAAVNEFAVLVSGIREVPHLTSYDLLGVSHPEQGQWLGPVRLSPKKPCVQCLLAGVGDDCDIERFGRSSVNPSQQSTSIHTPNPQSSPRSLAMSKTWRGKKTVQVKSHTRSKRGRSRTRTRVKRHRRSTPA